MMNMEKRTDYAGNITSKYEGQEVTLYGWMHVSSEVLELLTSRRAEQRAPDALWRPLWGIEGKFTLSRRCENSRNKMLLML